ncbi:hypothetical protein NQ318_020086 [Aromia moschata]|uniref:SAP domain-containing protein n=1 Tax=Aromia moschata TaxID=1265417 RepID=A0AAV8Z9S5_9CUCU|nr:hypothetical protein NQ318_020086 [Aromia moschata]
MADESLTDISALDISKLKVPDLKKELKMRGLTTTGNKNELVERLQMALKSNETSGLDSVDDLEEDLLNSVILDNELEDSPKAQKRKADETQESTEAKSGPPKKVILNRNNSASLESKPKLEEAETEDKTDKEAPEKKVIKLSQLSAKERLEMRAKKFGVSALSVDAKKVVRAERFGLGGNSTSNISLSNVNTSVDVLKQRAERFGGSVSTIMSSLENKEKLEKRKARFGEANGLSESEKASNGSSGSSSP